MDYIIKSSENPLGTIEWYWYHWENNEDGGNLPRIHSLLWTHQDKTNPVDLEVLQEKVKCSVRVFLPYDELQQFVEEGLLPNDDPSTISD
jgi:hypothetical protein